MLVSYSSVNEADWTKFYIKNLSSVFLPTFSGKKKKQRAFWYIKSTIDYGKFEKLSFTEILILKLLPASQTAEAWWLYLYLLEKKQKLLSFPFV